jgi:transposase-like protein
LTTIFALSDYTEAKKKFEEIRQDLRLLNVSAVHSLDEGLEDCLTLHHLGIAEDFSKSFSTTNCIESLNSQITRFTRNVRCWQNSEQRHRWIAVALLEIELRMNKVKNHKNLSVMQHAIKKAVQDRIESIPRRSKTSPISTKKRT